MELDDADQLDHVVLHGRRMAVRQTGRGPALLLVHGLTGSMTTWDAVVDRLADRFTVITPDLLGHGSSEQPAGDHSLGAHASTLRDLLTVLGHPTATVVGHSLGGGIAMQFAYQFPERCARLVLVSSGGLGHEVSPLLRAAALPGSELVLQAIAHRRVIDAGQQIGHHIGRIAAVVGLRPGDELMESARSFATLADDGQRHSFVHTLRSVVDHRGQRVSARDRLYLASSRPCLLVWGDRDRIIPVDHAHSTHAEMPGSRLELFDGAGHFPHRHDPERFARVVGDFIDGHPATDFDEARQREILLTGDERAPSRSARGR